MNFFLGNFKWLMLLSGVLTCTMVIGMFSPNTLLTSNFGQTMEDPLANIIVRNWAALITIIGAALIYGAFVPKVQLFALTMAIISKAIFITLVMLYGKSYLGFDIGIAVIVDSVMIILFTSYLMLSIRHKP